MAGTAVFATEKQIAELEGEIAEIQAKIETLKSENGDLPQLMANIEAAEKEIMASKEAFPQKEKSLSDKEFLLNAYQSAFRVVTKFSPGENLGAFVLKNGQSVEPSSFVSAGQGAILVQGATGSRSIPLDQLPDVFASKILLPPRTNPPSTSLSVLKQSKPDVVQGPEEKQMVAASSVPSGNAAAGSSSTTAAPAVSENAAPDYEAIRKRNEAREREINELKLRFSELFTQKKLARSDKASAERVFREAKIKKSQTEISSTLKMHDDKISRIELEESELRQRIARLQSEME